MRLIDVRYFGSPETAHAHRRHHRAAARGHLLEKVGSHDGRAKAGNSKAQCQGQRYPELSHFAR